MSKYNLLFFNIIAGYKELSVTCVPFLNANTHSTMVQLPVITSTFSPAALGEYLQSAYQLPGPVTCTMLRMGINHTFKVQWQGGAGVFRVYSINWRSEAEIQAEIQVLLTLQAQNVAVSYPLADKQGRYMQALQSPEGLRYGVMFSFAAGEKVMFYGADLHKKVGEVMAHFHEVTAGMNIQRETYTPERLLDHTIAKLCQWIDPHSPEITFMASTRTILHESLQQVNWDLLPKGPVHMDIWFDNMSIRLEGDVTIFDFDFLGNGPRCLDLAYYLMQLYHLEKEGPAYEEKYAAFMAGYNSVRPVQPEELQAIPALSVALYYFYLGIQCDRFENFSNVYLNEAYLKRYIEVIVKRIFNFLAPKIAASTSLGK